MCETPLEVAGPMAGTVRVVLGVLLIILGIFGLLLFFIGIIAIIIGAILVWSGRSAQQQERMNQALQQQQAQLAYIQGGQFARPPSGSPYGTPSYLPPPPPPLPAPTPTHACTRCGRLLYSPLPAFCPDCGTATARLPVPSVA
jgi:hypothetical protein